MKLTEIRPVHPMSQEFFTLPNLRTVLVGGLCLMGARKTR
jgi:hypothetical protein